MKILADQDNQILSHLFTLLFIDLSVYKGKSRLEPWGEFRETVVVSGSFDISSVKYQCEKGMRNRDMNLTTHGPTHNLSPMEASGCAGVWRVVLYL